MVAAPDEVELRAAYEKRTSESRGQDLAIIRGCKEQSCDPEFMHEEGKGGRPSLSQLTPAG
jgi:hypothetical protein